ncbi:PLD nuclease N-terminal domain-containing protein [Nocardiopsis sediminis]|uniref:PLD nuclease N-terminal domain-containing protein n=1 Tax=Nocardiopsis sediminis TaxID=1778267 RepID=A0ABV8FT23_9ACTN
MGPHTMLALDGLIPAELFDPHVAGLALIALIGLCFVAYVVFIVAAFLSALFSELEFGMKLVWAIFIICAPFLGALCWFLIGKRNATVTAARARW